MYKRHNGQVSMLESPEMFGSLPLDPDNEWIKLSKLVPWREFDLKYADNFRSKKGQRAIDSRMALGALLIKPAYKAMSDEDITREIAMNPYLQYFLGLHEYRYECPFDPSMMTRFRQRITPEMLSWVNDRIRDINGFFEAVEVYNELKPVQDKLDSIHWKKPREKYQAEHADELQRFDEATKTRKRVAKKYGITLPLDKAGRKLLKDKRAELEADNEKQRPQLETINKSLSQLNTLRYWTRKVVPEALEDRSGFAAELDTMRAKRELNEVIDKAVTAVVHPPEERHTEPILPDKETEKPHR